MSASDNFIPSTSPQFLGEEFQYLRQALECGRGSGDGPFTERCQDLIQAELGIPRVLLTTSCTHALELAGLLLGLDPGDEVIVPSFTFVSTASAFALRGARPVFVDIRPDTLNMDEARIEEAIGPRTRAIVPVHYSGVGCEMDSIIALATRRSIPVIEDNAHGIFGRYKGRALGTFGSLATLSFHDTKAFTCGEGGALLINDSRYCDQAVILRDKGTNRRQLLEGRVQAYTWVEIGSSYLLSDLLAAALLAQLERRKQIQAERQTLWNRYAAALGAWARRNSVRFQACPEYCEQSHLIFCLILPDNASREALIAHLRNRSIAGTFHYLPLHLSPVGQRFGGRQGQFPVTESVSACLLRLPLFNGMHESQQTRVIDAVAEFQV